MDEKTLHTLEYFKILDRLAAYAAFAASRDKILALRPTHDLTEAIRRQAETTEAVNLLATRPDLTIGGARDIRAAVDLAKHGGVLPALDLLDVKSTLIAARNLTRSFEKLTVRCPHLCELAAQMPPPLGLVDAISRVLNDRGEILDHASDKLANIRHDLRIAYDRLMAKLQHMVADPKNGPFLQEAIITQRDGRYVIPLRAEFKGRIRSIIHDQSSSGATLFIEPLAVVELNNQYRELQLAERDEERRLLAELSEMVGANAELILHTLHNIAEMDFIFTRAKYSDDIQASEPVLLPIQVRKPKVENSDIQPTNPQPANLQPATLPNHPGTLIRLYQARHPLLDPATVVPIDVDLDPQTFAMVVTGPNTGGKTVALKTVGLLILMAQSGLHIPAHSGSEISIFRSIFADIGDEQSIEQSLSTFSSHITNIVRILHKADRRSLVILDELGAGTDPQEGAALARALLSFLLERGITTLVTTHHPELKAFAHSTPGVVNACVEFDLHSLRPTYHLTIGLPGRSNALAIAKRLGMFEEVIEAARKEISPDDQRAGAMLDEIHYQRDAARKARGAADRTKHETEKLSAELVTRLEHIEAERREILEQARLESESQIQTLKDELREVRQQLKHAHQPLEAVQQAEDKIEALEEASTQLSTPENELHPTLVGQPFDKRRAGRSTLNAQPATISIGSKVHLKTLNTQGIITALGEDEAEVQLGMLHIRVLLADLQPVGTQDVKEEKGVPGVERSALNVPPVVESPGTELDLRGRRAEDALIDLDRYLENAYMAGLLWVRIIHGKGTGKLRLAVRELLGQHPHVKSFEAGGDKEGGEGVTVAKLHSS